MHGILVKYLRRQDPAIQLSRFVSVRFASQKNGHVWSSPGRLDSFMLLYDDRLSQGHYLDSMDSLC